MYNNTHLYVKKGKLKRHLNIHGKMERLSLSFHLRIETGFYLDEFDSVHISFRKYVCVFLLLHFVNIDLVHCESMREQRCAHITRT